MERVNYHTEERRSVNDHIRTSRREETIFLVGLIAGYTRLVGIKEGMIYVASCSAEVFYSRNWISGTGPVLKRSLTTSSNELAA